MKTIFFSFFFFLISIGSVSAAQECKAFATCLGGTTVSCSVYNYGNCRAHSQSNGHAECESWDSQGNHAYDCEFCPEYIPRGSADSLSSSKGEAISDI